MIKTLQIDEEFLTQFRTAEEVGETGQQGSTGGERDESA